jgi:hypothetical protein
MQGSWLDLAAALGLGGTLGALVALAAAGRRFATRLRKLVAALEHALLDLRSADLHALRDEMVAAEREARGILGRLTEVLRVR